ncbi:MAG: thioredoxin domain-containing protein [Porphyromonadaceae bacterium]|nr:thioredoxin domain-containing protein [Porphyromonadaceae bacterium]
MKKISFLTLSLTCSLLGVPATACSSGGQAQEQISKKGVVAKENVDIQKKEMKEEAVRLIDAAFMRANIFDYMENPTKFNFKGSRPTILDFYADWCPPCRRLSPKLIKLAERYKDKIDVYKINIDKEEELARVFGVKSIPMLLFIPMDGTPIQALGDLSEEDLEQSVKKILSQ